VKRRLLTAFAILLTANLLAASCSRKNLPPLVAPSDPAKGAFPPWAAVGDSSTYAVVISGDVALEMPLFRMGAQLLRGMAGKSGLDYDALSDALGFDPVLDIDEIFVTDAGDDGPGQGNRRQVIVLGYDRDVANLDVVLKLVGSAGSGARSSIEKQQIRGREVFFIEEPAVAIVGLDSRTVGVLRRFGPDDVDAWLEATARSSDVRRRAADAVYERIEDPRIGPPETRLVSAWVDVTALRERTVLETSPPAGMHAPLPTDGLRALFESMDAMVLHASYDGDLMCLQQAEFATGEQAAQATDAMAGLVDGLSSGSSMPFLGDLVRQVTDTLELQVQDSVLIASWQVPQEVLEAATAFVGLFMSMAQAMRGQGGGQGPHPAVPLPVPGMPPGPIVPPPGI